MTGRSGFVVWTVAAAALGWALGYAIGRWSLSSDDFAGESGQEWLHADVDGLRGARPPAPPAPGPADAPVPPAHRPVS